MADDDIEEDLGPQTFGEELFSDLVKESGESLAEDGSGRNIRVPKGTTGAVFFAALAYAAAKKITDFAPLVALGANPFHGAKLIARGMFIGFASLLQNKRLPGVFRYLLQSFGSLGEGYLDGTIDKARRSVLEQLTKWSALPNPESAMGPSLRIAQGIIEFNKDKIMGKASGLPGQSASTDGATNTDKKSANGDNANNKAAALPGTGTEMFIRDHLESLENKAGTDVVALAKINFMRGALAAYQNSSPVEAAYLIDASSRGLIGPEDIARALALPDTDRVSSGEKDAAGNEILILAREARLNDIVNIARKRVDEAKELTNPKPKPKASEHEGVGPKEIPIGKWGKIKNPTWEEPDGSDVNHVQRLADRNIADWEVRMGLPQAPRPPRTPTNWNLRGRLASVWARRTPVVSWFQGKWTWAKTTWTAWRAARTTPPTLPPQPPAGTP
jgi:hypothetical protein